MQIHLIAFDIPYPADYGGVIDVYYKIRALGDAGFQVILHCFQYGNRKHSHKLEELCERVFYYKRAGSWVNQFSGLPFIVKSRNSRTLLENLCKDKHPILFEGIHTTHWIGHEKLQDRLRLLRMHNIEWQYYAALALREKNVVKKLYLRWESIKLKRYEQKLLQQDGIEILAISTSDKHYFDDSGFRNVTFLPAFHPFQLIHSKPGKGSFALFHGNLGVADNRDAALFLIEEVFNDLPFPLVIVGKNPDRLLSRKIAETGGKVKLVANPDETEMRQLMNDAQVHVLWSFQSEGIKLKLYYALFEGRFVVANSAVTANSDLKHMVEMVDTAETLKNLLKKTFSQVFEIQHINDRKSYLERSGVNRMQVLIEIFSEKNNKNL